MVFSSESALHIRWPNYGVSASTSVLPMKIVWYFLNRNNVHFALSDHGMKGDVSLDALHWTCGCICQVYSPFGEHEFFGLTDLMKD